MKTSAIIPLLLLFFFAGCIQQQTTTYICPDGSHVQDYHLCSAPQQETPPQEPAAPPVQESPAENESLTPPQEPPPEPPPNISCYKEDSGDKFSKSTIVVRSDSTVLQQEDDVCLSPSDLKEFYCQGNELRYTTYECDNGCAEGKCNRELVRSECNDTDGGAAANHLNKRGQIIYTDYYSDGSNENRVLVEDYCDGTTLIEYSCPSPLDTTSRYRRSELACLGCTDGACPYN